MKELVGGVIPFVALAATLIAAAAYLGWAIGRVRLGRRRIPLGAAVVALLLPIYVAIDWTGLVELRYVRLTRPLLAIPCALALLFVAHRLLALSDRQHRSRRLITELCVVASALTAAFATIGLEIGRPLDRLAVIIALDRSRSTDLVPDVASRLAAELSVAELGMRDDDRIGIIAFGADAAVEEPLRPKSQVAPPQRAEVARDGTDIAGAMRRALAEVPADSAARIVLVTDGVSTRGDPFAAAAAALAAGVPVDAVLLEQSRLPDIRIAAVRAGAQTSQGEAFELGVVTVAPKRTKVELRLYRDGTLIRRGETTIEAGEDVLRLREVAPEPGLHRYDVELSAADAALDRAVDDNTGSAFVRVRGQAVALVMERDPVLARSVARALESAAFRVDVVGPTATPADIAAFAAYDLVVLSDIAAADFAPSQLEALGTYVRHLGGGLLLLGGENAMGPGGYSKSPIEEVSPVFFDIKQDRRRASLAEIIAVDFSGSMAMTVGSQTKLELANEAAVRSMQLLGSGDELGVMHVDTEVHWTVPLEPVVDKPAISKRIRAVGPGGGGIFVDLTLRASYAALAKENTNLKHLLLFADGSDAEERAGAFSLVSNAKRRGITTSVVALGRGPDVPALERMSKLGDGRFYLVEDAARLPAIFAQETVLASRSSINEIVFRATPKTSGPVLRGIDFSSAPPLTGYVVTIAKPRALVHLSAAEGDPLLAAWSVGVGRAAAFTSDYKDRWGVEWTGWPGAARLFAQLGRDLARRSDDPRVRVEASTSGGELSVNATAVGDDGRAETFRRLKAVIVGPDGKPHTVALEATGAGSYSARIALSRPGAYVATAIDEQTNAALGTTGAVLSAGEELRPTGSDRSMLARIAAQSDGKLRDTLAGIFEDRDRVRFAYQDLERWLLALATLALLLGVAARRLAVPPFVARAVTRVSALVSRPPRALATPPPVTSASVAAPPGPQQSSEQPGTFGSLLAAKARSTVRAGATGEPSAVQATPRQEPAARLASKISQQSERADASGPRVRSAAEILLERRKRTRR